MNIRLSHADEIKRYGETEYPYECCGILLGKFEKDNVKNVEQILPVSNARDENNRHNRFLITPEELMHAEVYARKNKLDILGFYHSHPDHPAAPSDYDLQHAWPLYSYIIVSVRKGKAEDFTSWELKDDRTEFNQESINIGD